jgi:hypothetical protein
VSINIIVAIAGICPIDLCYIFVIHTQQAATQRNKISSGYITGGLSSIAQLRRVVSYLAMQKPVTSLPTLMILSNLIYMDLALEGY